MSDIVERLRDRDAVVMSGLFHAIPTMQEAAAEIERLRILVERQRTGLKTLLDWNIGIQNGHGNHHVQDHINTALRALEGGGT